MHKSPTYSKIVSCSKIWKRNCHHKQDFSFRFLLQIQIVKSYNFCLKSACGYEFQTLPHPTIFLTACIRSKESISIPAVMQENLVPISTLSFHWLTSETKRWNLELTLHILPLNKTINLPPCHLTTLSPFPTCHVTTFPPFQLCHLTILPSFPPSHLTTLTPLPPSQLTTLPPFPAHRPPNNKQVTPT